VSTARDPLTTPIPGDRFRLRSGVEVEVRDAGFAKRTQLVDDEGRRHPFKTPDALRAALVGATVLPKAVA
jgi:hypothetical protein